MAENYKKVLQKNYEFLIDEILEPVPLADFLFSKEKISDKQLDSIHCTSDTKGKFAASRECLNILCKARPDTYECFKEFLKSHSSREFILEKLEEEIVEEIRVVMFGKTGVGKSFLGNNILEQPIFLTKGCSQSVTTKAARGERGIGNHCKLVLIDTPGLFDTSTNDNMETAKILARTVKETKPGPHVFIFVISIGNRFTAEEKAAVEFLKDLFGSHVTDYLIIVFTRKDDLDVDNIDFETYIKDAGDDLKLFVNQCQGKMAINNRASPGEVTKSVNGLLEMIKSVYLQNEKQHYTDELLAEAQTIFKEKLCQQEEEAHRRERELEEENDLLKTQHKTEFKEYQDKQQLEKEKLHENIRNEKEQNKIFLRKQEEAHRRERELEEENDLIKTQHKTEFKEYQDKQQLEKEKLHENIRNEKKQNKIFLRKQEEAHRRERELEEENDLIKTQHKFEFKKYQVNQRLEKEKLQEDIRKEKEQNNIFLRQQEEKAHRRERELEDKNNKLGEERDLIIKQHTKLKENKLRLEFENTKLHRDVETKHLQVDEIAKKIQRLIEEKEQLTTEVRKLELAGETESISIKVHTKKRGIEILTQEIDKLNIVKKYAIFGHDESFRHRMSNLMGKCTIQ